MVSIMKALQEWNAVISAMPVLKGEIQQQKCDRTSQPNGYRSRSHQSKRGVIGPLNAKESSGLCDRIS